MPEEENNPAAGEGTDNQSADEGENSPSGADQNKPDTTDPGNEDAGDGEDKGGTGDNDDPSKGQEDAKAPEETSKDKVEDQEEDDGKEPPVRKRLSKQDFIIRRQKRKLDKIKENQDDVDDDDDDSGDDISLEDEAIVTKIVAKQLAPLIDKNLSADDNDEIGVFLKDNPDFKSYEAKVRRFMQHSSRRQLPIKSIFYEVAGDKLLKIGAERQKEADKKAKDSQTGGGSNRAGEGSKSVNDLTKEEFAAEQERVLRGRQS